MLYSEKYDDAFSFFFTRDWFPETIICDYCCIFTAYCINREPSKFKKTLIVGDEFHFEENHKCSICFSIKTYKEGNIELRRINSSSTEQQNSCIAKLKSSSRYMRLSLFSRLFNVALEISNRLILNKM